MDTLVVLLFAVLLACMILYTYKKYGVSWLSLNEEDTKPVAATSAQGSREIAFIGRPKQPGDCDHDWKIVKWRKMSIFYKMYVYISSGEELWYHMWVDWQCTVCGEFHTTMEDHRIPVIYGRPGVCDLRDLDAMWELKFGKD